MKKKLIALVIIFCSLLHLARAQNLVPNGSFENYTSCPSSYGQIYKAVGWFQPNKIGGNNVNQSSSSDYFNTCGSAQNISVPNNIGGFQIAKTGGAYIGISYYSYFINGNAYREYAEVELSHELISNRKYNLKYFVSMSNDSPFSITKFDAYLSNDSLLYSSNDLICIPVIPQFQYNSRIVDTLNWVEINVSFTANGGERFLTLGNFHDGVSSDSLSTNITPVSNCCYAYYYIDDVSLEEDTLTSIYEINRADFNLFPNPAANKIRLSAAQKISSIKVLNLQRKPVLLLNPGANQTEIALDELTSGIYFVECKFTSGETITKKLVVQR